MTHLYEEPRDTQETVLRRVKSGKYARGTVFVYHDGSYDDGVGNSWIGRSVRALCEVGAVHLMQKRYQDEPRKYLYLMVVK